MNSHVKCDGFHSGLNPVGSIGPNYNTVTVGCVEYDFHSGDVVKTHRGILIVVMILHGSQLSRL